MLRPRLTLAVTMTVLMAGTAVAQNRHKIKELTPTYRGSTGLFSTPFADTLRAGEFSFGLNGYYVHREPGDLSFTVFPITFTVGIHDRIEFFASYEVHKRVHSGPSVIGGVPFINSIQVNSVPNPSAPQTPTILPNGCLTGGNCITSFFNDSPFLDNGFGSGPGELYLGAKFNLLSERRGNALGLAFQPTLKFDLNASRGRLARGLSSGVNDAGFDFIVSKNLPKGATYTFSTGFMFNGDPGFVERQDSWNYGTGFEIPLGGSKVHFLGEVAGRWFIGDRTPRANPKSPVDVFAGLRAYPSRWITISGGYAGYIGNRINPVQYNGMSPTDRHGWWAQVSLNRKVNRPPTITCSPTMANIECTGETCDGGTATFTADAFDPDDDNLNITWTASSGRISGSGESATFDATGMRAGTYTVKAEVSDGDNVASCGGDVTVVKRKVAPTVTCQPSSSSITEGQSTTLRASASDGNGDPLRYAWTVNGQSISNDGSSFEFGSVGRNPGNYTVRVTVSDIDNMTAGCDFSVSVNRRDNNPPTVNLTLDKTSVYAGDTVNAAARANDPDGDPVTLSWQVDGQSRAGSGTTQAINTTGMTGTHQVGVTARDDRGGSDSDTASFSVINERTIQMPLDNIGKAKLDEVALMMTQEPRLKAVLTGYTDDRGSEETNMRVGERRAQQVKDYLVKEKGISADRIETQSGGESDPVADNSTEEGRKANQRVEIKLSVM